MSSNSEINVLIDVEPDPDENTPFSRIYDHGSRVTLTTPQTHPGYRFVRWNLDGVNQPDDQRTLNITMTIQLKIDPVMGAAPCKIIPFSSYVHKKIAFFYHLWYKTFY